MLSERLPGQGLASASQTLTPPFFTAALGCDGRGPPFPGDSEAQRRSHCPRFHRGEAAEGKPRQAAWFTASTLYPLC